MANGKELRKRRSAELKRQREEGAAKRTLQTSYKYGPGPRRGLTFDKRGYNEPAVWDIRERRRYGGDPRRQAVPHFRKFEYDTFADDDRYMKDAVRETADVLTKTGQAKVDERARAASHGRTTPKYKRGGKVRRTGLALVHRGERVLTKAQNRKYMRRKTSSRK